MTLPHGTNIGHRHPPEAHQSRFWLGPTAIAPTTVVLTGSTTNPFLELA